MSISATSYSWVKENPKFPYLSFGKVIRAPLMNGLSQSSALRAHKPDVFKDGEGCTITFTTSDDRTFPFNQDRIVINNYQKPVVDMEMTISQLDSDGKEKILKTAVSVNLKTFEVQTNLITSSHISSSDEEGKLPRKWTHDRRKWRRDNHTSSSSDTKQEILNERESIKKLFSNVKENRNEESRNTWTPVEGSLNLSGQKACIETIFPTLHKPTATVGVQTKLSLLTVKIPLKRGPKRKLSLEATTEGGGGVVGRKSFKSESNNGVCKNFQKSSSSVTSEDFDQASSATTSTDELLMKKAPRGNSRRKSLSEADVSRIFAGNDRTTSLPLLGKNGGFDVESSDKAVPIDHDYVKRVIRANRPNSPDFYGFLDNGLIPTPRPFYNRILQNSYCDFCSNKTRPRNAAEVQIDGEVTKVICIKCFEARNISRQENVTTPFQSTEKTPSGWSLLADRTTGRPVLQCDFCAYESRSSRDVKCHDRLHKDNGVTMCVKCEQIPKNASEARRHVAHHRKSISSPVKIPLGSVSTKCSYCSFSSFSLDVTRRHQFAVHFPMGKLTCPGCDFFSVFESELVKHVDQLHPKLRPFVCHVCFLSHDSLSFLKKHIMIHKKL